jgi:hypothetical protein
MVMAVKSTISQQQILPAAFSIPSPDLRFQLPTCRRRLYVFISCQVRSTLPQAPPATPQLPSAGTSSRPPTLSASSCSQVPRLSGAAAAYAWDRIGGAYRRVEQAHLAPAAAAAAGLATRFCAYAGGGRRRWRCQSRAEFHRRRLPRCRLWRQSRGRFWSRWWMRMLTRQLRLRKSLGW